MPELPLDGIGPETPVGGRGVGEAGAPSDDPGAGIGVGGPEGGHDAVHPDLGTVEPIPFPLSSLLRRWSRELAAAQTIAVVEAGARTVSIGDLLGPEFAASPADMFSQDRFHPSPAGYARVASAILPTLCAALGVWEAADGTTATRDTETTDREASAAPVRTVSEAADAAVRAGGTEVAPVDGDRPGPRDRLAVLLRRRRATTPEAPAAAVGANPSAD